jgi:hypothetical protein
MGPVAIERDLEEAGLAKGRTRRILFVYRDPCLDILGSGGPRRRAPHHPRDVPGPWDRRARGDAADPVASRGRDASIPVPDDTRPGTIADGSGSSGRRCQRTYRSPSRSTSAGSLGVPPTAEGSLRQIVVRAPLQRPPCRRSRCRRRSRPGDGPRRAGPGWGSWCSTRRRWRGSREGARGCG